MTIYVIRSFLHVGFRFQHQLVNLAWLSFDFFSFSWSLTICFFCGFTLLCVLLSSKCFLFIITCIFSTHFAIKLFYLRNLKTYTNYETTTAPCMWTNEIKQKQNQTTPHSNRPRVLLLDLAHEQCNGIIKGWLHCLTSESKGRFLVDIILMFGSAWCLVMVQIQFSLIKKKKIRRPEHSLTLHPVSPITSHFCLNPSPPPQVGRHMCITS